MDPGINYEIWTTANSGDFKRKTDVTDWVLPGTTTDNRLVDLPSGVLRLSDQCPDLAKILTVDRANHVNDVGSALMMFREGVWIAAYVPTRRITVPNEETPWADFELSGLEWYLDRGRVKAFDNPAKPIKEGDWIYGAPTILTDAGSEVSNAWWFLDIDGASAGTFTITDGTDTTSALAWNLTSGTLKTELESDITAIVEVIVSGSGTPEFPFIIQLVDPSETDLNLVVADSTNGTVTLTKTRTGGSLSPRPWHGSIDGNTGVVIGNYQSFEMVTAGSGPYPAAPAGSSSTELLHINAATPDVAQDYAGGQVEVQIQSGHRHRAEINAWSETAQTLRLVIRTQTETLIAYDEQALSADTWTTLSIPSLSVAEGAGLITYRVGIIVEGDADSIYLDVNEAVLAAGEAAANFGEITTALRTPMDARSVLDWVIETWGAVNDSSAVAWDRDLSVAVRHGQSMMHWIEYGSRWGYERSIRYNGGTATPFDFNLYNPGNRDSDPADVSVSAIDGMIAASPVEEAAPDFTTAIAEGDQGNWGEHTDSVLATAWGKLEGYFANKQGRESANLDALAEQMVADSAAETVSHKTTVQNPSLLYGTDFILGDTIPVAVHAADGSITPQNLRLVAVTIEETATLPIYHYSFGAVVFDPEAAQADALRTLIRRFQALDESGQTSAVVDPVITGSGLPPSAGAHIHLTRNATQVIAVDGEAVSWDSAHAAIAALGFTVPSFPTTAVTVIQAGYYNVAVQLGWASFTGGGSVWVNRVRNGVEQRVWPPVEDPGSWSVTSGSIFEATAPAIPCASGDQIKVYVDHDDGSTQTLVSATLGLYLVDRAVADTASVCPALGSAVTVASAGGKTYAFPGFVVADDDTHLVAYRDGTGHVSTDGVIRLKTSTDGGATWGSESTVYSNGSFDLRGASLTKLASGRIVCVIGARSTAPAPVVDGGFTTYTDDEGGTWSAAVRIDDDGATDYSRAEGGIVELENGDWLLPVVVANVAETQKIRVLKSADSGTTWTVQASAVDSIADDDFNEPKIVRVGSELIMLIRDNAGGGRGEQVWRLKSSDDGVTWSPRQKVLTSSGAKPDVGVRVNGDLVMGQRDNPNGVYPTMLVRSSDLGVTWTKCEVFDTPNDKSAYSQANDDNTGKLGVVFSDEVNASTGDAIVYFKKEN